MKKIIKNFKTISFCLIVYSTLTSQVLFAQGEAKLTDAEIASVAVVANQNDIDFAQIAKEKSKNSEVLKFAETMVADHKAIIELAVALVTKLNVTPKDNAVSKQLLDDAEKTKKMLRSQSAKDFDEAYVNNEVAYHKAVVAAVETVLIPQSTNQELKSLLKQALGILKTHLAHAEMVQKNGFGKTNNHEH